MDCLSNRLLAYVVVLFVAGMGAPSVGVAQELGQVFIRVVNQSGEGVGVVIATADAPTFIEETASIPQNINWAGKSVFASALFTPPAGRAASTVDPDDVIAHVTDATCARHRSDLSTVDR